MRTSSSGGWQSAADFLAARAAFLQMPLHLLAPALGDRLVREIDPFLCRKMRHLPFPPAFRAICSPADGLASFLASAHKGLLVWKKYSRSARQRESVNGCLFCDLPDEDEGSPKIGVRILFPQFVHRTAQRPGYIVRVDIALVELLHQICRASVMHIPERKQQ